MIVGNLLFDGTFHDPHLLVIDVCAGWYNVFSGSCKCQTNNLKEMT